jgi:hypothetical protein
MKYVLREGQPFTGYCGLSEKACERSAEHALVASCRTTIRTDHFLDSQFWNTVRNCKTGIDLSNVCLLHFYHLLDGGVNVERKFSSTNVRIVSD